MASRAYPLKKSSSFGEVAKSSKKLRVSPWLILQLLPSSDSKNYFGITISRKVAGSVVRNKLKRWVRNCVKNEKWPDKYSGYNVVFVFRPQANAKFFTELTYVDFKTCVSPFFSPPSS